MAYKPSDLQGPFSTSNSNEGLGSSLYLGHYSDHKSRYLLQAGDEETETEDSNANPQTEETEVEVCNATLQATNETTPMCNCIFKRDVPPKCEEYKSEYIN